MPACVSGVFLRATFGLGGHLENWTGRSDRRAAKRPCDATASVVISLPLIRALPVSGNQDKDRLSLRTHEHHQST